VKPLWVVHVFDEARQPLATSAKVSLDGQVRGAAQQCRDSAVRSSTLRLLQHQGKTCRHTVASEMLSVQGAVLSSHSAPHLRTEPQWRSFVGQHAALSYAMCGRVACPAGPALHAVRCLADISV